MKKLFLLLILTTIAFGQGFELARIVDVPYKIKFSFMHNDSFMFYNTEYVDSLTHEHLMLNIITKISDELDVEVNSVIDTHGKHYKDFETVNDSIYYLISFSVHSSERRRTSYLETYVWGDEDSGPFITDIDSAIFYDLPGETKKFESICKVDSFLIICSSCDSLQYIYSISDPLNPTLFTTFSYTPSNPASHRFRTNFVFEDTLLIFLGGFPPYIVFDISDINTPEFVYESTLGHDPDWLGGSISTYNVMNDYLIVSGVRMTAEGYGFLSAIDISNPLNPDVVYHDCALNMIESTVNNGNIIMFDGGNEPYSSIRAYDFTMPEEPIMLGRYPSLAEIDTMCYFLKYGLWGSKVIGKAGIEHGDLYSNHNFVFLETSNIIRREYDFVLKRGWNLVSYPLFDTFNINSLFNRDAFLTFDFETAEYDYTYTSYVEPGKGFWVLATHDTVIEYSECPNTDMVKKTLYPGWNLIGPTLLDIPSEKLLSNPDIIPPIYDYNTELSEYIETDTLRITHGYWVFATDTTTITTFKQFKNKINCW